LGCDCPGRADRQASAEAQNSGGRKAPRWRNSSRLGAEWWLGENPKRFRQPGTNSAMAAETLEERFEQLNVWRSGDKRAPHKRRCAVPSRPPAAGPSQVNCFTPAMAVDIRSGGLRSASRRRNCARERPGNGGRRIEEEVAPNTVQSLDIQIGRQALQSMKGSAIRSTGRHLFCARWSGPAD